MDLIIKINLDNAAMRDEDLDEVSGYAIADVLAKIAAPFNDGATVTRASSEVILDANGNVIGSITVTE